MPWSVAAAVAGAVVSSELAPDPVSSGKAAASAADPFASQRGQYQTQLAQMMGAPSAASAGGPQNMQYSGSGIALGPATGVTTGAHGGDGGMGGAPNPQGGMSGMGGMNGGMNGVPGAPNSNFTPTDPSYAWRLDQGAKTVNAGAAASGMLNSGNRLMALQDYGQGQASTEYANQFSRLSQLSGANIGSPAAAGQIISGAGANQAAGASAIGNSVGSAIKGWGNSASTPAADPVTSTTQNSNSSYDQGFSFADAWSA